MSGAFVTLNIVLTVLGFLVSVGVPLLILFVFRRLLSGRPTPAAATAPTQRRHSHWKWLGLIPVIGVSLFIGLMVASIGGALYPPLTRIAAPLACDGDFSIKTSNYSYKPGQSGSTYQTLCVDRTTGESKDVSTPTFLWNSLIFAGAAFIPLLGLSLLLLGVLRRLLASLKSPVIGGGLPSGFGAIIQSAASAHQTPDNQRSIEDRLRELLRLHERGLIDASDFESRKAQILAEL